MTRVSLLIIGAVTLLFGCSDRGVSVEANVRITEQQMQRLQGLRVFFAHQSVGGNILDGVASLNGGSGIRIVQTENPHDMRPGAICHARVGTNGDAIGKIRDFERFVRGGIGDSVDIAMVKLCYVDVTATTNTDEIYGELQSVLSGLRRDYPGAVFTVATVPLTTRNRGIKGLIRAALGKRGNELANIKRAELNRRILETPGVPVFDLAAAESTRPDGSVEGFTHKGTAIPTMVPEYTYDGGHLNEAGRKVVAARFLEFLSRSSPR